MGYQESHFKPLLESHGGLHLSAYIEWSDNIFTVTERLRAIARAARIQMAYYSQHRIVETNLAPLERLMNDKNLLKKMNANFAIFIKSETAQIVRLPIPVETTCFIASSFHVKPLLKWLQFDSSFFLLGLTANSASLFAGSALRFGYIDDMMYPEMLSRYEIDGGHARLGSPNQHENVVQWVEDLCQNNDAPMFIAGDPKHVRAVQKRIKYQNVYPHPVSNAFSDAVASGLCLQIRTILREEAKAKLEKSLIPFNEYTNDSVLSSVIQIAKAAVAGEVKKLVVAEDAMMFGKLNSETGELKFNASDSDHEDDDLFDDIAQTVWRQGGEVVVANTSSIPMGRPILAIVDKPS